MPLEKQNKRERMEKGEERRDRGKSTQGERKTGKKERNDRLDGEGGEMESCGRLLWRYLRKTSGKMIDI